MDSIDPPRDSRFHCTQGTNRIPLLPRLKRAGLRLRVKTMSEGVRTKPLMCGGISQACADACNRRSQPQCHPSSKAPSVWVEL